MANFKPGVGRLATDRYDFQSHLDGKSGFRHNSKQIDITPTIPLGSVTNLDDALSNIGLFINSQLSKGEGFITVGDGYDSWANANALTGVYFDNTTPYLDDLLNPIFQAIMDNGIGTGLEVNPLPAQYERIKRGGIVLIRAGTYIVKSPILVPPGIVIVGEGFGTKIINATSLTLNPLPPTPKISPTPAAVFKIIADGYRTINDAAVAGGNTGGPTDYHLFMLGRKTVITNLVISDNFVENTILGDVFYKIPQNKTGDTPLIQQEQGSNLILDNVYLMGRVNFSSGQVVSQATRFAIQLDGYSSNQNGTILKLNNSFIDGFSIPIDFQSAGGSNDYLEIVNNKIRAFGYLDGYGNASTNPESNCIVRMNDNNAVISDNHLYGNSDSIGSAVFINAVLGTSINLQAKSKIILTNNNIVIDRSKNTTNTTFKPLKINSTITNFGDKSFSLVFGNVFQSNGFEIAVDGYSTPQISVSNDEININGSLSVNGIVKTNNITNIDLTDSPYTIFSNEFVIFVDTSSGAVTVTLPDATINKRFIQIKDTGTAGSSSITINTSLSQTIDGASSKTISSNYGVLRFLSNGTNWFTM